MLRTSLLFLLVLVTSCRGHYAHRIEGRATGTVAVKPGTIRILLENHAGYLSVEPAADDRISFEAATLKAADTEAELAGLASIDLQLTEQPTERSGEMRLVVPGLPKGADQLTNQVVFKGVIRIPPSLALCARIGLGQLSARGITGEIDLETGVGDVVLKNCRGNARLRTGKGQIIVDAHKGALDAETASGTMLVFVSELGQKGMRLVSGAGGIQAHLPRDAAFALDLRVYEGKYDCTWMFPVERRDGGIFAKGVVGKGVVPVFISSRTGSVSLRADEPERN